MNHVIATFLYFFIFCYSEYLEMVHNFLTVVEMLVICLCALSHCNVNQDYFEIIIPASLNIRGK